jgi:hypothetical protein
MNSSPDSWLVTVESFDGFTHSTNVLESVAAALDADATALGPAVSLDTDRGVLSATFGVRSTTQGRAAELAIASFYAALSAAGFDTERPGWSLKLEIEPYVDEGVPAST